MRMAGYAHINRCTDLSEDDVVTALAERRAAKALLERLAKVSRPREGASKALVFIARLAGREVDWIEGWMRVEVVADGDGVVVEVLSDLGLGMRERLLPSLKMDAPFREFARLVEHMPSTLEPLIVMAKTAKRLALSSVGDETKGAVSLPAAPATEASPASDREAPKRSSRPSVERGGEVPARIPARSGKTLRPALMGAPAPSRKKTLRPEVHAVPPPVPSVASVPRAPALPRTELEELRRSRSERPKGRGVRQKGDRS